MSAYVEDCIKFRGAAKETGKRQSFLEQMGLGIHEVLRYGVIFGRLDGARVHRGSASLGRGDDHVDMVCEFRIRMREFWEVPACGIASRWENSLRRQDDKEIRAGHISSPI
jgi:hypothetical protein